MDSIKEELALEYARYIDESLDYAILVQNTFTTLLSTYIKNAKVSFVASFKDGFNLFLRIKEKDSILLIENDLLN